MSFLVDPPLLVGTGAVVAAATDDPAVRRAARLVTLATFIGTSSALYLNHRWTRPLWRLCRADSGRDWMINSGVTHFDHVRPRTGVHLLAVALFALYPAWYRAGERAGDRISGRLSHGEAPAR